jgi:hypothetical protein
MFPNLNDLVNMLTTPPDPEHIKRRQRLENAIMWTVVVVFVSTLVGMGWALDTPTLVGVLAPSAFICLTGGVVVVAGMAALLVGVALAYILGV